MAVDNPPNINDNNIPSGLEDLLRSIRDQPEPENSLTLYEGKRDTDLIDEEIDERILRLLELEDTFDIDYGTYKTLLRGRLQEGRLSGKELPREEDELLVSEFKRIKSKVGRFKVKKKTVSSNLNINVRSPIVKSTRLLPPSSVFQDKTAESSSEIVGIEKLLDSILATLRQNNEEDKKKAEADRKKAEENRRKLRESRLEKGLDKVKSFVSKIVAPFQSFIEKIKRFFFFTLLGRAFKLFMDWASDPNNRKKLQVIGKFLKDWWPALLGAWFLFANPLGKFIRSIIGTIAKLTIRLAKFAIPKLLSFIKSNPLIAAGALTGITAFGAEMWRQGEEKRQIEKEATKRNIKPQDVQKEVDSAKSSPMGMFGDAFSKLGPFGYNSGGSIFSGFVGDNGTKVSGAGADTQLFPIEGGGSAVLSPGELVLTEEQQSKIAQDTGVHPATYVQGIQPRKITGGISAASTGGVLGYNRGGIIGALGRFLPRTGTIMSPRGSDIGYQDKFLGMNVGNRRSLSINKTYFQRDVDRYNAMRASAGYPDSLVKDMFGRHFSYIDPRLIPYTSSGSTRSRTGAITSANNQQLQNAIRNARNITNMPGGSGYRPLVESASSSSIKMQQRYDALRNAMRDAGMEGADQNMNLYGKPIKRQGGGLIPQGPFTPLPSPGYVRPQGSFIPRPMLSLPGPRPGTTIPFGYDPFKGLKGGGLINVIKENTGYDVSGTADRQYLPPMRVQPGEGHYIIPQGAMQRGAVPIIDQVVAQLDPDSTAKKRGYKIDPPSQSNFIALPPSIIKSATSSGSPAPAVGTSPVPTFSAYRRTKERMENMKTYTLSGSIT